MDLNLFLVDPQRSTAFSYGSESDRIVTGASTGWPDFKFEVVSGRRNEDFFGPFLVIFHRLTDEDYSQWLATLPEIDVPGVLLLRPNRRTKIIGEMTLIPDYKPDIPAIQADLLLPPSMYERVWSQCVAGAKYRLLATFESPAFTLEYDGDTTRWDVDRTPKASLVSFSLTAFATRPKPPSPRD